MYIDFCGIYLWPNELQRKGWGGWRCGKGSGAIKKIKKNPYIPASVPSPSPACAPDMPATVLKNRTPKVRQQTTSQDNNERKRKALTFSEKIKILDYMRTHQLTQKQTADYWQDRTSKLNSATRSG